MATDKIIGGATEIGGSLIDGLKAQPALLYLTLVNLAFLIFVGFLAIEARAIYADQQEQLHERYQAAISTIDRCVSMAFGQTYGAPVSVPGQRSNRLPGGGP